MLQNEHLYPWAGMASATIACSRRKGTRNLGGVAGHRHCTPAALPNALNPQGRRKEGGQSRTERYVSTKRRHHECTQRVSEVKSMVEHTQAFQRLSPDLNSLGEVSGANRISISVLKVFLTEDIVSNNALWRDVQDQDTSASGCLPVSPTTYFCS